ncbi:hypothetical protein RND81_11G067700 [Saponaria officinalis]|uniref:Uncharacterized protein n=1 Tax=Saponaria officinalis TaxID=3572 RepID=A0AAW1HIW5_SAPOF
MEIRGEPTRLAASIESDDYLETTIQGLHKPDSSSCFLFGAFSSSSYVKHLFPLIEELFDRTTQTIGLYSQMTTDVLKGMDAHSITIQLLKLLQKYTWEDKVVLTLTSFGLTFGDFWVLIRIYSGNAIKEFTTNDQSTVVFGNKEAYQNHLEANNDLIKDLINTTRYIIEIEELTNKYSSKKSDRIPINVYWIMRSAIVAATQIIILSSRGPDQYVVEVPVAKESVKLKDIIDELRKILSDLHKRVAEKEIMDIYEQQQIDNIKLMRCLINPENDSYPLYHGTSHRNVEIDILRGKHLLLLISGINIASEDIEKIKNVIFDSKTHEIMWIPVVESSFVGTDTEFQNLQNSMPWYSVRQLSMVSDAAVLLFKNEWHFKSSPIVVVLNPHGKVLNQNAIHMVRIWQNLSIDKLTTEMELQMWEKETWDLRLLVNDVDPKIQEWIKDEKYIFLYGGNDIDWIRNFTRLAHFMANSLQVKIEMVYMGLSHSKDHVQSVSDKILAEQLTHCLPQSTKKFFWSRIASMIYSILKLEKRNNHIDTLLDEILKLHSHKEWALLAKGSKILVHGPGRIAMTALEEIQNWRERGIEAGYVNQFLKQFNDEHHCHEIFLPATEDVLGRIWCPSCGRSMENFVSLICC